MDAVFPMLYHSFYEEDLEWIGKGVEEGLAALEAGPTQAAPGPGEVAEPKPRRLFAGLYLPALSEEERPEAQEIAREAGAHGVSFFELGGLGI